jgi:hypothetical protein
MAQKNGKLFLFINLSSELNFATINGFGELNADEMAQRNGKPFLI